MIKSINFKKCKPVKEKLLGGGSSPLEEKSSLEGKVL